MRTVYSVEKLNEYISRMFRQDNLLSGVFVQGEVSNCKYHSSGHVFFTLKDEKSAIDCIIFSSVKRTIPFILENGMKIIAGGSVDLYVKNGDYRLCVRTAQKAGIGELTIRLEQLKAEFKKMGYFDEEWKRPIPKYASRIGLVTSPTGAAIRDMIAVSKARNPYVSLILYPALVQGEGAAESIVRGIHAMEHYGVDVIIVGRGGGSIEDLWAFNEEIVAHAIFECSVPVISAVGHETDFMISDLVADMRAATPSRAAELAVSRISDTDSYMKSLLNRFDSAMDGIIQRKRIRLSALHTSYEKASPKAKVHGQMIEAARYRDRLLYAMKNRIKSADHTLLLQKQRLQALSPLNALSRGMAYVLSPGGDRISSVRDVSGNDRIRIRMKDGYLNATVDEVIGEETGNE
ncbi:MAG: exodeoxyribonuclease VII large subunit [Lachnospiraceae bacterium]|nr:exodeoxyribonuclease VII large subunit [Lachnospiraceae bacterium]